MLRKVVLKKVVLRTVMLRKVVLRKVVLRKVVLRKVVLRNRAVEWSTSATVFANPSPPTPSLNKYQFNCLNTVIEYE